MKSLERLSHIAVICVAVIFGVVLIKNFLMNQPPSPPLNIAHNESHLKGKVLNIHGAKWSESGLTVVLALSTSCHFCTESMPFYEKLIAMRHTNGSAFRVVTIFPQDTATAETYLKRNNILPDGVISLRLGDVGVNGTPTLLLVNSQGVVQNAWVGKLTEADEREVLSKLQ